MALLYMVTGAMAAGKSTVSEALARRLDPSVHLRGDVFRKMIVNGRAEMGPVLSEAARAQLDLRHDLAVTAARRYVEAGFHVVLQDILIGADLVRVADGLADLGPRVVVLAPDARTLMRRDRERAKTGYGAGFPPEALSEALARETPRPAQRRPWAEAFGTGAEALEAALWIDSAAMSVEAVVARILGTR